MGRRGGKNKGRSFPDVEKLIPQFKWENLAQSFMELSQGDDSSDQIAAKLSRGYFGQRQITTSQLSHIIRYIFDQGRGGSAFRIWFASREGDPGGAAIVAKADVASQGISVRLAEAERARDSLIARVRDLDSQLKLQEERHKNELRAARETATQDDIRRLSAERNEAKAKRSEAEYALKTAIDRAEKAEDEVKTLRRRPIVDANKLAEMQTTHDGLSSQISRLQIKVSELTKELDEKDVSLRGALARLQAAEEKPRPAKVIPMPSLPTPMPTVRAAPMSDRDLIDTLVDRGLMTPAEAYEKLRRAL